jgi:molybdate transport system regulatory protein
MSDLPPPRAPFPGLDTPQATRLALLSAVRDTGSISKAAHAVGLSYKGAWQILDAMNRQSHEPLFTRSTGGTGGGGTRLTAQGEALLAAGAMLSRLSHTLSEALNGDPADFSLLARLGLKTSARNQFAGRIGMLTQGAVNDTVSVVIGENQTLLATVTRDSSRAMGLREGGEVLALFKAGWVMLATAEAAQGIAIANRLYGTVSAITRGAVNSEVQLTLRGGGTVCAMLDTTSLTALTLRENDPACALISPAHIILAALA